MVKPTVTLSVRIKGKKKSDTKGFIAETHISPKNDRTYIEGRKGSQFELLIRNNGPVDILAIPSIDGLSVMDGTPASDTSGGYIVPPYSTIEVKGWRLDDDNVAQFYFSGKQGEEDDSYVSRIGEDVANKGVIGLLAYERKRPVVSHGIMRGLSSTQWSGYETGTVPLMQPSSTCLVGATLSATAQKAVQELGTGFGDKEVSKVRREAFERGKMLEPIAIFYDNRRGLRQHGIDISKKREVATAPNPFPNMGCRIPTGWKG